MKNHREVYPVLTIRHRYLEVPPNFSLSRTVTRYKHMVVPAAECCGNPECSGVDILLVQRGYDDGRALTWGGVPCGCGKTFQFELIGDRGNWEVCDDVYPEMKRMHCWARSAEMVS